MKTTKRLHLGAAYYPEHWPEERWLEDIRLMKKANFSVVRLAEFAWSTMEPAAGVFEFEWLDRAIELLADAGIQTVLGTPTAAPPAWLVQQCPDVLATDESGRNVQFGNRCHYCINSPDFHDATQRIVSAMAEQFGDNSHIIGWQIDNEFNRICYCDHCRKLFQRFLAERYGSLDELNMRWTTRYWSQTYSDWSQIPIPIGSHNPGLMLAFRHFVTASYRQFQKKQIDILRAHLPEHVWITHNFMPWFDAYDHYELGADLDMVSWDMYVQGGDRHDFVKTAVLHDLFRGVKQRNFWLMETQPGQVNWMPVNDTLNKQKARTLAWQAVGHGADAILYWQWRSALGGQEQYHDTLIDQSGQPRPFYSEVRRLGVDLSTVSDLLAGSTVTQAKVALLHDHDSRWSIEWQKHHEDFDYPTFFTDIYRPFVANNVPVDVISADESLEAYRLVVAPALTVLKKTRVERLAKFVKEGGYLILTLRTGMKDEDNALLPTRQPGALAEIAGVEVEEYYALAEPIPVTGNWFEGESRLWAERLRILDSDGLTNVVARYGKSNGWLDEQIAVTVHPFGRGMVYTVGAYLDESAMHDFITRCLKIRGVGSLMKTPAGVEVCRRITEEGDHVDIVINHTAEPQLVHFSQPMQEHITGQIVAGDIELGPYVVGVLTKSG